MTKSTKEVTKVPFYKKATFPWAIILIAVVFFGGVVTGWVMRSEQESTMDSIRATALSEVKTSQR